MAEETSYLRFELEGAEELDLNVFALTSVDLDLLLRRITERRTGHNAHWRLATEPVIHVAASANGVSASALADVVADTYSGVAATQSEDPSAWPASFELTDRKLTRRIVNRLRRSAPVAVDASNETRLLIPTTGGVGRNMRPIFAAWSTIEGRLRALSDAPSPQFVVYEQGTNNPVRCTIDPSQYDEVYSHFRAVVRVHGFIYYRATGKASSVRTVTKIERLAPPERALTEFIGLIPEMTGDVSPGEYIRRLRAGGDD